MADFKPRGSAQDFWNTVKSISAHDIVREASRPISVALVGSAALRLTARNALFVANGIPAAENALPEPSFLQEFDNTSSEAGFPQDSTVFDIVIDVGSG